MSSVAVEFLHPRSILTLAAAVFFATGLIMTLMGRSRRVYPGYWHWVWGEFAFGAGALGIALRDVIPLFWTAYAANALLLLQPVLIAAGLRRFLHQTSQRREVQDYLLWLFCYAAWLVGMQLGLPLGTNVFIFSLGFLLLCGRLLQVRQPDTPESVRGTLNILLGSYALCALAQLIRGVSGLTMPQNASYFDDDPLFGFAFLCIVLLAVITISTLLLMTNERAETELRAVESQLTELANTDGLTGLANRRHFLFLAERLQAIAERGEHPALLIIDVDHFKGVNDERGHATGDIVLRAITAAIHEVLRSGDTLGRLGGDEFAVLLPETNQHAAERIAGRIVARIRALTIPDFGPAPTLSVGLAVFEPGETVGGVMRRADQALYAAKRAGRNCAMTQDGLVCEATLEEEEETMLVYASHRTIRKLAGRS
ncbi:GGDEF domain-containing protein [Andreprevotia chitinilytica]|uniref:GGDEF domain-containing protein n=1 Tax=Andreprevotia chitinilytica TaxID=396808 RepID=UPI00068C150F|nr:GGDEF domain-containing protein [Andreprevotia chitinilytica]